MAAKTYNLDFSGYNWENSLPEAAGIYLTYTLTYNAETQKYSINKLKYIGESNNIKARQQEHLTNGDYPKGVKLAYAYALLPGGEDNRKRCEAAMIFNIKPEWNTANTKSFDYDATTVKSTGKHIGVPEDFTVLRSI